MFSFTISAFCTKDFIEGIDYTVDFHEKSPEMAATLHVNFVGVVPEPSEAEKIVKQKLRIYGNKLIASNKVMHIEKKHAIKILSVQHGYQILWILKIQ
jgi:hypothetical protein